MSGVEASSCQTLHRPCHKLRKELDMFDKVRKTQVAPSPVLYIPWLLRNAVLEWLIISVPFQDQINLKHDRFAGMTHTPKERRNEDKTLKVLVQYTFTSKLCPLYSSDQRKRLTKAEVA